MIIAASPRGQWVNQFSVNPFTAAARPFLQREHDHLMYLQWTSYDWPSTMGSTKVSRDSTGLWVTALLVSISYACIIKIKCTYIYYHVKNCVSFLRSYVARLHVLNYVHISQGTILFNLFVAIMRHRSGSTLVQAHNRLLPDSTKPLSEPMWTSHEWSLVAFTLGHFHSKYSRYLSLSWEILQSRTMT